MVYKKYHKRGGKTFGPYYYSSYRHDGKVKKIYIGGEKAYKEHLKKKKRENKENISKKNVEQQKGSNVITKGLGIRKKDYGKLLFVVVLIVLVFFIGINIGNYVNLAKFSFTGMVVDGEVIEPVIEQSLYGFYEDEIVVEEFDTGEIDLEIINPPKFDGIAISKNKNKRMDFKLSKGDLRLYFDLIDYSEFVKQAEEIIITNEVKQEIEQEEERKKKERQERRGDGGSSDSPGKSGEAPGQQEEEDDNETSPGKSGEAPGKQDDEELADNNGKSNKNKEDKSESEITGEVIAEESESEPTITGNIIRGIMRITAKVIGFDDKEEEIEQRKKTKKPKDLSEIREGVKKLNKKELEAISKESVISVGFFDINVQEAGEIYKWGYEVELIDLNFIAKIDITSDQDIFIYDDYSLQIEDRLLSFADLVDEGYNVRIEMPSIEMEVFEDVNVEVEDEEGGEDQEEAEVLAEESGITGGIIRGLTGFVIETVEIGLEDTEIKNIVYDNVISVYIERDFSGTEYSVGDIIYLDPTLTIIEITKAIHLDSDRNFISDIYGEVKERDDNWSEVINSNEYVRAIFELNLTNNKDITLYARSVGNESVEIEVYEKDSEEVIAVFENVFEDKKYQIFLTDLTSSSQDVFDLKVVNGAVEFDYIVDPTNDYYVDGFDSTYTDWTLAGSSPYLDAQDQPTNMVSTATGGENYGDFSFPDLPEEAGSINSVNFYVYATCEGDFNLRIRLWDSGASDYVTHNFVACGDWGWKTFTATELDSVEEVNAAKFFVRSYATAKNPVGSISVDAAYIRVDYDEVDSIAPNVTINYPANTNYSVSSINFNITAVDDTGMSSCWYTLNSGVTNYTMTNTTAVNDYNHTNSSIAEGTYTANFYCNDTNNNVNNSMSVVFGLDTTYPLISIAYPVNGTVYGVNITELNYTRSDDNLAGCWYSIDSGVTNSTYDATCANITSLSGVNNENTWTIYVNDSAGNENNSLVTFYSTYVSDCATLNQANTIYTLQNDMSTAVDCLVIGANNITIDMAGYKITHTDAGKLDYGIDNTGDYANLTVKNGYIYDFGTGIYQDVGDYGNFTNLTIETLNHYIDGSVKGIFILNGGDNNYMSGLNISVDNAVLGGGSDTTARGIYIASDNNVIENTVITRVSSETGTATGIYIIGGLNNNITDTQILSIIGFTKYDVYLISTSTNNIFLNTSYDVSKENVASGSSLIRKWYYQAYVNDTSGNDVSGANVSQYVGVNLNMRETTNSSGWINQTSVVAYVNNGGTKTEYNWLHATNGSQVAHHFYNASAEENNLNDVITIDFIDPAISYDATTDADGSSKSVDNIFVNVSVVDNYSNVSTFIDFDGSLIMWMRMDDVNASGDPTDYLGVHNGTAINQSVQTDDGKLGKGFAFDGDGDYIEIPHNENIDFDTGEDFSISLWFKTNKDYSGGATVILQKNKGGGLQNIFFQIRTSNDLRIQTGASERTISSPGAVNDGIWHQIVLVHNSSIDIGYLDGVYIDNDPASYTTSANTENLQIGVENFMGSVDDVMIFNRSLSAVEVRGLYANTTSRYLQVNYTSLAEGSHTFKAYTQDAAGNVNASLETRTVSIDTTYPQISIATPSNNTNTIDTGLNVNYTFSDTNVGSCWWTNDTGANNYSLASCGTNITTASWPEGSTTVIVYINDSSNNVNSSSVTFTVDTTYPQISIAYPVNGTVYGVNITELNYTSSDTNLAGCWYSTDSGVTNSTYDSTCANITSLSGVNNENTWTVYMNDSAGNENSSIVTFYSTYISDCATLNQANTVYTLQNDMSTAGGDCLVIDANNITIDMAGYYLNYTYYGDEKKSGIDNTGNYSNLTVKNGYIYDFAKGVNSGGDEGNFTNLTIEALRLGGYLDGVYGIYIYSGGDNNYMSDLDISLKNTYDEVPGAYGIYLGSDNNVIENTVMPSINGSSNIYGIYLSGDDNVIENIVITEVSSTDDDGYGIYFINSNNNNITNTQIIYTEWDDVYLASTSTNNLFLNTSYDLNRETVQTGSSLIRKWYYQAYVNDTNGNDVVANVSATNSSGSVEWSVNTNASGWIADKQIITDYFQNSTNTKYYYNSVVSAVNSSYPSRNSTYDATIDNTKINDVITMDNVYPLISFGTGTETDGSNITRTNIYVNVSVTESNEDTIVFNLFYSNATLVNSTSYTDSTRTINWTGLIDETYNFNVTVNDTSGNTNSTDTYVVTVDTTNPLISIAYPVNGTVYGVNITELNYTRSDDNLAGCWYSIDSGVTNSTYDATCANITSLSGVNNENTWTIYVNDSAGNENSSIVTFYSTYVSDCATLNQANQVYTLQNDMSTAGGDCFVIGANNITIDMAGYNITRTSGLDGMYGINNSGDYANLTVKNGYIYNFATGVYQDGGDYGNFTNLTIEAPNYIGTLVDPYGIYISSGGDNNYMSDLNISIHNFWGGAAYGIYLDSDNNVIENTVILNVSGASQIYGIYLSGDNNVIENMVITHVSANGGIDYGIYLTGGDNNNITDSQILNADSGDLVYLTSTSTGNIFLNTSYHVSTESVAAGSSLIRKWYYQTYVNDSLGNDVVANISATNSSGSVEWSVNTNSSGWIASPQTITDYVNTGSKNYYNSVVSAVNSSYPSRNSTYDATIDNTKINDVITMDNVYPLISFGAGTETDGSNITRTNIYVNVSVTETNEDTVKFDLYYSNNTLVNRTSYTDSTRTINWTDLIDETYNFNVTVNDTSGNSNSTDTYVVTIDTTNPLISIAYPVNGTVYGVNITELNYTSSDTNLVGCWYSTDSGVTNSTYDATCANITSLSGVNNENTWTIYVNDSAGNENSSIVTFYSTYVSGCGTLNQANTVYTLQNNMSTDGDCFIISANNITLDMAGYSITSTALGKKGIDNTGDYANLSVKNGYIYDFKIGIFQNAGDEGNFTNLTIEILSTNNRGVLGISIADGGDNNYISGLNISVENIVWEGGSGSNAYGIYIRSDNNVIENTIIARAVAVVGSGVGIFLSGSSNNNITNTQILITTTNDVFLSSTSTNNIFLNTSYSPESVAAGSSLIRKWYYQANVTEYYSENTISGANVTAYNSSGSQEFSLLSGADGLISKTAITDYINNGGTRTYSGPHTINTTNASYQTETHTWNVTAQQNTLNAFYMITDKSEIVLNTGWNLVALNFSNQEAGTDRNVSLVAGWNLIGYSSDVGLALSSAKIHNGSNEYTWVQALANNKVQGYLSYYDSDSTTASERKYKYLGTSGVDASSFVGGKGYWIYSNSSGNLTLPSVGGSLSGETYDWAKLRFRNGSGSELNITDAGDEGWVDTSYIQFWNDTAQSFKYVCLGVGFPNDADCQTTTLDSWQGYFVDSLQDNLTLIRQN